MAAVRTTPALTAERREYANAGQPCLGLRRKLERITRAWSAGGPAREDAAPPSTMVGHASNSSPNRPVSSWMSRRASPAPLPPCRSRGTMNSSAPVAFRSRSIMRRTSSAQKRGVESGASGVESRGWSQMPWCRKLLETANTRFEVGQRQCA